MDLEGPAGLGVPVALRRAAGVAAASPDARAAPADFQAAPAASLADLVVPVGRMGFRATLAVSGEGLAVPGDLEVGRAEWSRAESISIPW